MAEESGGGVPRVRLKDVAQRLGLSVSVISKALHNTKSGTLVSADKCALIRRVAAEMGYSPDFHARSMVSRRSYTIGLVARQDYLEGQGVNIYLSGVIARAMAVVQEKGCLLTLLGLPYGSADYANIVEVCRSGRVDGLLVSPPDLPPGLIEELRKMNFPMAAYFGKEGCCLPHNQILPETEPVTAVAAEYLHGLGHRRMAYLHFAIPPAQEWERHAGLADVKKRHKNVRIEAVPVPWDFRDRSTVQEARSKLARLFEASTPEGAPRYTAAICDSYYIAELAVQACRECGKRIPQEMSVLALEDHLLTVLSHPPLTVTRYGVNAGEAAARMLLEFLATGEAQKNLHQTVTLVPRESTGPVAVAVNHSRRARKGTRHE